MIEPHRVGRDWGMRASLFWIYEWGNNPTFNPSCAVCQSYMVML